MSTGMESFQGLGVADGIAIGTAVCISTRIFDIYQIPIAESAVEDEVERFGTAVETARAEIQKLGKKVGHELGEELGNIFDAQALFLADSTFLEQVISHIRSEKINAEWAIYEATTEIQARFNALDSAHFRERSEDLRDVSRYLVRRLRGIQHHELSELQRDVVIVADDLTPSDAVRLGRENVVGFAIEHGSRTSHTTIVARSLNIPAVAGVTGIRRRLTDQSDVRIIVDGRAGKVILRPDGAALSDYRRARKELERQEIELLSSSELRAVTRDGVEIQLMANIDLPEEIADAERFGAAGVGLYRSEFLYIERSPELPTEEEHVAIYRQLLERSAPHPAIIRTYDLGGRKIAREVMHTEEENPVLGLRGIRLTLARPEIFKTQLRALFRAGQHGDLWIMLPLVTVIEEVRAFRSFAESVMAELEQEGTPFSSNFKLGIMIEVPAAAMISDILAREVDFFSIGTNDLIQYALAVDRNNEHVAHLYRPLHPGMIRMLHTVGCAADEANIEVSLCGEMAADSRYTPIILGCGLRRLSVSPRRVPAIKNQIRRLSYNGLSEIVKQCMSLATAAEVHDHLRKALGTEREARAPQESNQ